VNRDEALRKVRGLLPAGEWTAPVPVTVTGMMATGGWALFGRTTALRDGRPCFFKFIPVAASGAGSDTHLVAGPQHLDHLAARLERLRHVVGIVPILRVDRSADGLLVVMEEVVQVDTLIKTQGTLTAEAAARLVRDLVRLDHWHHFDICPKNIGRRSDGSYMFIDLESLYLVDGHSHVDISVPACKTFRWPPSLEQRVLLELQSGNGLTAATAGLKQSFEITLAACESMLGNKQALLLATGTAPGAPADRVERFWHDWLAKAATGPIVLEDLAKALLALGDSHSPSTPNIGHREERASEGGVANELRRDALAPAEIKEYARQLRGRVTANAKDIGAWRELQLVTVAYLRDPGEALSVIEDALIAFPDDAEFSRWLDIVRLWVARSKTR
jgi:hypothetical protein